VRTNFRSRDPDDAHAIFDIFVIFVGIGVFILNQNAFKENLNFQT
jgi:hypothetical protein